MIGTHAFERREQFTILRSSEVYEFVSINACMYAFQIERNQHNTYDALHCSNQ